MLNGPQLTHVKVIWHHNFPDEPVLLYSELDADRYEVRKVEVYRNNHHDCAGPDGSTGTTALGVVPVPDLDEIATLGEFTPTEITPEDFEATWLTATTRTDTK